MKGALLRLYYVSECVTQARQKRQHTRGGWGVKLALYQHILLHHICGRSGPATVHLFSLKSSLFYDLDIKDSKLCASVYACLCTSLPVCLYMCVHACVYECLETCVLASSSNLILHEPLLVSKTLPADGAGGCRCGHF